MQVNRIIIDKDALQNRYLGRLGMLDLEDLVIRGRGDVKNIGLLIVSQSCGSHDERCRIESKPVAVSNLGLVVLRYYGDEQANRGKADREFPYDFKSFQYLPNHFLNRLTTRRRNIFVLC